MEITKKIRGFPVIVLVLLGLTVVATGAVLYTMYISNQFTESIEVYGIDALAIQSVPGLVEGPAAYAAKTEATSLGVYSDVSWTHSTILVLLDYDISNGEAIVITPRAFESDGITPYTGWDPLTHTDANFYILKADGSISGNAALEEYEGDSYIIRIAEDMDKMLWDPTATLVSNAVVLRFDHDPFSTQYSPGFASATPTIIYEVSVDLETAPTG